MEYEGPSYIRSRLYSWFHVSICIRFDAFVADNYVFLIIIQCRIEYDRKNDNVW